MQEDILNLISSSSSKGKVIICKDVCILKNLLEPGMCENLIRIANQQSLEQLATRKRLQFDCPELAAYLWEKISPIYPYREIADEYGEIWRAMQINPHFRFVSYQPGDKFAKHEDGFVYTKYNQRSFASLTIYLNSLDEKDGGATHFTDFNFQVQPTTGSGLLFLVDDLLHEGRPVTNPASVKYILRTDILYGCPWFKNDKLRQEIYSAYQEASNGDDYNPTNWEKYQNLVNKLKKG